MLVLEVKDVEKTYVTGWFNKTRTQALCGVSLQVERGEIVGLLGHNGAGKTTLLSIMSTMLKPDQGEVILFGRKVTKLTADVRSRINMSSGHANFPWSLKVRELLHFYGMLYGLSSGPRHSKVDSLIELFGLGRHQDKRFDALSTGTKQRLALAKSFLNDPELLFLDEPTVGLDPTVANQLRSLILRLHKDQGLTVIVTTHNMAEAEKLCDRVAFIRRGKIILEGRPSVLKEKLSKDDLEGVFLELASRELPE